MPSAGRICTMSDLNPQRSEWLQLLFISLFFLFPETRKPLNKGLNSEVGKHLTGGPGSSHFKRFFQINLGFLRPASFIFFGPHCCYKLTESPSWTSRSRTPPAAETVCWADTPYRSGWRRSTCLHPGKYRQQQQQQKVVSGQTGSS